MAEGEGCMGTIFLIADSHFGSTEVIRVFKRPFKTAREMDRVMTDNWNRVVGHDDIVISVGDLTRDPAKRKQLLCDLNGNKILIRGNHDRGGPEAGPDHMVLSYRGQMAYLVHNPLHVPGDWNGWVIHGHHHGTADYPFIDGRKKTINVGCELTGYAPVEIDRVLSPGTGTILRMETAGSVPIPARDVRSSKGDTQRLSCSRRRD